MCYGTQIPNPSQIRFMRLQFHTLVPHKAVHGELRPSKKRKNGRNKKVGRIYSGWFFLLGSTNWIYCLQAQMFLLNAKHRSSKFTINLFGIHQNMTRDILILDLSCNFWQKRLQLPYDLKNNASRKVSAFSIFHSVNNFDKLYGNICVIWFSFSIINSLL